MNFRQACWKRKKHSRTGLILSCYDFDMSILLHFSRLKKKKEQNLRAKQIAEETGNTGRLEITAREETEAENNVKKLQDVRRNTQ